LLFDDICKSFLPNVNYVK